MTPRTPQERLLLRVHELCEPRGYRWIRSTYELHSASKEPRSWLHLRFGSYPELLNIDMDAWVAFRPVEIVAWRIQGLGIAEAKQRAKKSPTIGRYIGRWTSRPDEFEDVLSRIEAAFVGQVVSFHSNVRTMDDAVCEYERHANGEDCVIELSAHAGIRHLCLLYVIRDRHRFDLAASAWDARTTGMVYRPEIDTAAWFLREHWDTPLALE